MKGNIDPELVFDLVNAFTIAKGPHKSALLLQDLLTASEIKKLSRRLRIAKLLLGGMTQREVSSDLRCSLATVTKVKLWLDQKGEGFKSVIKSLPKKYEYPSKLPKGPIEYHMPQAILALAKQGLAKSQDIRIDRLVENVSKKEAMSKHVQEAFEDRFKRKIRP